MKSGITRFFTLWICVWIGLIVGQVFGFIHCFVPNTEWAMWLRSLFTGASFGISIVLFVLRNYISDEKI